MKAILSGFVQLAVIIMALITLAVSSAAVAQWVNAWEAAAAAPPVVLVSDAGGR